jgi:hypothetical protein
MRPLAIDDREGEVFFQTAPFFRRWILQALRKTSALQKRCSKHLGLLFPWWSETRPTPQSPGRKEEDDGCTWMKVESINELRKILLLKHKFHPHRTLFYPIIVIPAGPVVGCCAMNTAHG